MSGMTRDRAIEILRDNASDASLWELAEAVDMAIEALKRPHGEWTQDFTMDTTAICSKCGEKAWYKEYRGCVTKSNFCPNCGADMRPRPSKDCMRKCERIRDWLLQGMKEGEAE